MAVSMRGPMAIDGGTPEQVRRFAQDGYLVSEHLLPDEHIAHLRLDGATDANGPLCVLP